MKPNRAVVIVTCIGRSRGLFAALLLIATMASCRSTDNRLEPGWGWEDEVRIPMRHCVVRSALEPIRVFEVAHLAEWSIDYFVDFFGYRADPKERKILITLFANEDRYLEYARDAGGRERTPASFYMPNRNEVVIRNDDSYLFHEMFHAYYRNWIGLDCQWIDEGFAQCFERLTHDERRGLSGIFRSPDPKLYFVTVLILFSPDLLDDAPLSWEKVVRFNDDDYRQMVNEKSNPMFHFGSWALAYFAFNHPAGDRVGRELLQGYLKRLEDGEDRWEAFRETYRISGDDDLTAMLREFYRNLEGPDHRLLRRAFHEFQRTYPSLGSITFEQLWTRIFARGKSD
ncbi:MAG: hypothetical protein RL885_19010 [Planctomycetota bacterium]